MVDQRHYGTQHRDAHPRHCGRAQQYASCRRIAFRLLGRRASCCSRVRNDLQTSPVFGPQQPLDFDCVWPWTGHDGALPTGNPLDPAEGSLTYYFFGFGSLHDGVCNFALADGSVRPINKSIDHALLRLLATRAGGEPVNSEFRRGTWGGGCGAGEKRRSDLRFGLPAFKS